MTHPPQAIQWVGRVTGNKVFPRSGLKVLANWGGGTMLNKSTSTHPKNNIM